jgi:hypothetical protein
MTSPQIGNTTRRIQYVDWQNQDCLYCSYPDHFNVVKKAVDGIHRNKIKTTAQNGIVCQLHPDREALGKCRIRKDSDGFKGIPVHQS